MKNGFVKLMGKAFVVFGLSVLVAGGAQLHDCLYGTEAAYWANSQFSSIGHVNGPRAVRLRSLLPVAEAAARAHKLDPELILAVISVESGGHTKAVSHRGAVGPMQIMPATARWLGLSDPMHAAQNIYGGAKYLRYLLNRFNGNVDLALAAYNAGPERVARMKRIPPFAETQQFVRKVKSNYALLLSRSIEEGLKVI